MARGDKKLTTYGELADVLERLPQIVEDVRRVRGLSQREVCRQAGVSQAAVHRLERREGLYGTTILALLRWLDRPTEERPADG
jgi:transcriptional regulator with XRE-family HTH domain